MTTMTRTDLDSASELLAPPKTMRAFVMNDLDEVGFAEKPIPTQGRSTPSFGPLAH